MQQAAELSVAAPTIEASLDGRFLSGLKQQREAAAQLFSQKGLGAPQPIKVRAFRARALQYTMCCT